MKNVKNLAEAMVNFKEATVEVLNQVENCSRVEMDTFEETYRLTHSFDEFKEEVVSMVDEYLEAISQKSVEYFLLCIEDGQYLEKSWIYKAFHKPGEETLVIVEEFLNTPNEFLCSKDIVNEKCIVIPSEAYALISVLNESGDDAIPIMEALKISYKNNKVE